MGTRVGMHTKTKSNRDTYRFVSVGKKSVRAHTLCRRIGQNVQSLNILSRLSDLIQDLRCHDSLTWFGFRSDYLALDSICVGHLELVGIYVAHTRIASILYAICYCFVCVCTLSIPFHFLATWNFKKRLYFCIKYASFFALYYHLFALLFAAVFSLFFLHVSIFFVALLSASA